jgi:prepilin-type N-terminal cleavage/methylation domain-containing protein
MKYQKGFTLIEMMVSVSILLIISGISVSIFVSVILGQRKILANQELYNQLSYALEYMSKSMRMAGKELSLEEDSCLGVQGRSYLLTKPDTFGSGEYLGIKFINQSDNNICQEFYLEKDNNDPSKPAVIMVVRGSEAPIALTSNKINVNSLRFIINGDPSKHYSSDDDGIQPRVTILLGANLLDSSNVSAKIQTTISQRNLNIK